MNSIREFYHQNFPTDEVGLEINPTATFGELYWVIQTFGDVYEYIGVGDSLVRVRLFEELAITMGVPYDTIYSRWIMAV